METSLLQDHGYAKGASLAITVKAMDALHTHGLEELSSAVRYREYLFELISPFCGTSILEVGSGLGDFAAQFSPEQHVIASDSDSSCIQSLTARFSSTPHVEISKVDIREPIALSERVDTVLAINVLEHITDDGQAMKNAAAAVKPGGSIVLFVPAYPALYGQFDRLVGHVRRYTPSSLRHVVEDAGLNVRELRPVNFIGGIAWWVAVRLGKSTRPRPSLIRIYDRILVPIVRLLERRIRPPFGQSLFCVATIPRPEENLV